MQFSTLFIASAAFALASAKVQLTNVGYSLITAGKPFTFTWSTTGTGAINLVLRGAQPGATVTDPGNLAVISAIPIGSGLTGGSYVWEVPATIPQSTYAIEIQNSTNTADNNYSTLFEVIGGVKATTTKGSNSTASATESSTSTGTDSVTLSATGTSTRTVTTSASRTASSTATPTGSAAPAGGMASGVTSNLAFVFVAAGALFMLN